MKQIFEGKYVKNKLKYNSQKVVNYKQADLLNIVWADICVNTKGVYEENFCC